MREVWRCEQDHVFPIDRYEYAARRTAIAGTAWRMRGFGLSPIPVDAFETRPCKEPKCSLTAWKTVEPGTALAISGPDAMAWSGYRGLSPR